MQYQPYFDGATAHYQPDVSVILPIYNAGPYLDQALDSVQTQSHRNIEIICINDGSTDDSLEIMQQHAAEDSRIRVINRENHGYGAEMNRGIDEARGKFIAILEPDDWLESNMFADMLEFASQFDEPVDIVKTPYWRIWMPDTPQQRKLNCSYRGRINPKTQPFQITDPGVVHILCHHPSIWSALYRKDFLTKNNIRFHEIPGAGWADNPFLIDTLCRARRIIYLDQAYYCYREETPEKSKNFALKQTLLPFERWNDMKDILDQLHVTDEGILRAHNSRGFTYLSGVIEEVPITRLDVHDAALAMFNRMDDKLVFSDLEVSPGMKQLYAQIKGLPAPKADHLQYVGKLIGEGIYSLKNVGPSFAFYETTKYFQKHKRREGRA